MIKLITLFVVNDMVLGYSIFLYKITTFEVFLRDHFIVMITKSSRFMLPWREKNILPENCKNTLEFLFEIQFFHILMFNCHTSLLTSLNLLIVPPM